MSRCRRLHQRDCEGPTTKGLCAKHAAMWHAMQADWEERAQQRQTGRRKPPPAPPKNPWQPSEIDTLTNHSATETRRLLPHRTDYEIAKKRLELGFKRGIRKDWHPSDDDVIRHHRNNEAAILLGRSVASVQSRRSKMGIHTPASKVRPWTTLEDEIVRHKSFRDTQHLLPGRTRAAIKFRRQTLGVTGKQERPWGIDEDTIITNNSLVKAHKQLPHRTRLEINRRRKHLTEPKGDAA